MTINVFWQLNVLVWSGSALFSNSLFWVSKLKWVKLFSHQKKKKKKKKKNIYHLLISKQSRLNVNLYHSVYSADNKVMAFLSFFQKTGFDISCQLSLYKTICMKCTECSVDDILKYFSYVILKTGVGFSYILSPQDFTFPANCLQWRFAWNVKPVLREKIRKEVMNLPSAELAQRVIKVQLDNESLT